MVYVMSDIHGCCDSYLKMLDLISFSDDDTLYILGDLVDRGENSIGVLLDVMNRKNVIVLRGNHDDMAADFFGRHIDRISDKELFREEDRISWFHNGRDKTSKEFYSLDKEVRERVVSFLTSLPLSMTVECSGNKYHLSHTVPEAKFDLLRDEIPSELYLWGEPDFGTLYDPDMKIVIGHTPTMCNFVSGEAEIYRKNGLIDIDCGAVFGGALACLRLDDGKEFYIKTTKEFE